MSTALEGLEQRLQDSLGVSVIGLKPMIRALTIALIAMLLAAHFLLSPP